MVLLSEMSRADSVLVLYPVDVGLEFSDEAIVTFSKPSELPVMGTLVLDC